MQTLHRRAFLGSIASSAIAATGVAALAGSTEKKASWLDKIPNATDGKFSVEMSPLDPNEKVLGVIRALVATNQVDSQKMFFSESALEQIATQLRGADIFWDVRENKRVAVVTKSRTIDSGVCSGVEIEAAIILPREQFDILLKSCLVPQCEAMLRPWDEGVDVVDVVDSVHDARLFLTQKPSDKFLTTAKLITPLHPVESEGEINSFPVFSVSQRGPAHFQIPLPKRTHCS